MCLFGWIFVHLRYLEVAQMTLEQVAFLFKGGFGVEETE